VNGHVVLGVVDLHVVGRGDGEQREEDETMRRHLAAGELALRVTRRSFFFFFPQADL
jgi:hypothetical protein